MQYLIKKEFPSVEEYQDLFASVGWERDIKRIEKVKKNTCYAISIYSENKIVGMGRMVGDGCYFTIYDVVVRKEYQGKGIGKLIVQNLIDYYKKIKDDDTFLYLGASKNKESFYERFGFKIRPTDDTGAGMKWYENKNVGN